MTRQVKSAEQIVASMTMEELYIALGRYCGPNNAFLAEKKYGTYLPVKLVEDEIAERLIFGQ